MPHGMSWFNFLPFYENIQHFFTQLAGEQIYIQHVLSAFLTMIVIGFVAIRARITLAKSADHGLIPDEKISIKNVIELILEALYNLMKQIIGKDSDRYFLLIASLAFFIFFNNILGLIPGFIPPTDNINTTAACAVVVFLYYHYHGIRVNGFHHITHIANPVGTWWGWFLAPLMLPIELISHFARPLSLSLRLMGNMTGDHMVIAIFLGLIPFVVPLPFLIMGFLVCVIQTMVFCLLSTVYVSLAVAHEEEGHH